MCWASLVDLRLSRCAATEQRTAQSAATWSLSASVACISMGGCACASRGPWPTAANPHRVQSCRRRVWRVIAVPTVYSSQPSLVPKRARACHQRIGASWVPTHCSVSVLPRRPGWDGTRRRRCTLRAGGPGGALPAGRLPCARRVHDAAHGAAERAAAAVLAPADAGDPGRRHGPRRVQKPPAAARADKEGAPLLAV